MSEPKVVDIDMSNKEEDGACGCCHFYHRADWYGDCREDTEGLMEYGGDEPYEPPPSVKDRETGIEFYSRAEFAEHRGVRTGGLL